jgi:membrane-bound lytic murein transglycosylase D
MPYTGKLMGMKINVSLDERKSIIASTETACDYFKNSQMLFDDWLMSIASYNCGAGNVKRAIRRAGGGKKSFWQILPYLPKETQYYVPKFIAMTYVLNFTNRARNQEYNKSTQFLVPTRVDTSYHLVKMCNYIAGDESHKALSLNREFIKPNTANATNNTILLPYDFSMNYVRSTDSLMEYALIRPDELKTYNYQKTNNNKAPVYNSKTRVHTVRKGETLSQISRRYGVSVAHLKSSNGLRSDRLRVGQRLIIRKGVTHKRNYN